MIPCLGSRGRLGFLVLAAGLAACGQLQQREAGPDPSVIVPRLFDPTRMYAAMGFFAKGPPVPFVAGVRYLAGPHPDTTLAVFGLSLANNSLSFRRNNSGFEATYRVELVFRQNDRVVKRVTADETVRVGSFQETLRSDESVIFQEFVPVPAGGYELAVLVRDEYGGAYSRDERSVEVPSFRDRHLSDLIATYEGTGRTSVNVLPALLVNPRATTPYGLDTLTFYVEAYGLTPGTEVVVRGLSPAGDTIWTERTPLQGTRELATGMVRVAPDRLPVGELTVVATAESVDDTARTLALVSFSDQWAITNFLDVLSLLRHFGHEDTIDSMRLAEPSERPARWRMFWEETDPDPVTPENEALEEYFRRVQIANMRFRETGDPGWLTDRGEVYITLGDPDEVFDQSTDLRGERRIIRWTYFTERAVLDFVDDTGFGRFRLTPISRSEFHRVLSRIRREAN